MTRLAFAIVAFVVAMPSAEAGRGGSLFKYLADDATVVIVVDVAHARDTPMVKRAIEQVTAKLPAWTIVAKSGVALDKDIDTVVIGSGGADAKSYDRHPVIVVEGRLDKVIAAIKKASAKPELHAGVAVWQIGDWDLVLLDHHLVATAKGEMGTVLDRRKKKLKSGARGLLAAASPSADAFGVVVLDHDTRAGISSMLGGEPEAAVFSLAVASRLTVDCSLRLADDATATTVGQRITAGLPMVHDQVEQIVGKEFADSIMVDQDHSVVRVSGTLTAEEVDKIVSKLPM